MMSRDTYALPKPSMWDGITRVQTIFLCNPTCITLVHSICSLHYAQCSNTVQLNNIYTIGHAHILCRFINTSSHTHTYTHFTM